MRHHIPAILCCISAIAQTPPTTKPDDKCSVEGTVISATTGEPLKKTSLLLRSIGQPNATPYGTTTDAGGHFEITGIDPGRYNLFASRTGYLRRPYSPKGDVRQSTPLTLDPGRKLKEIVFKLTPQGVISGRILDEDGDPLEKVMAWVSAVSYKNGKRQIMGGGAMATNDVGEFRIAGLSPGKYIVGAAPPREIHQRSAPPRAAASERSAGSERAVGAERAEQALEQEYVTTLYANATSLESAAQIDVAPGAQVSGINITMARLPTARIQGRVSLPIAGRIPRNARLWLSSKQPAVPGGHDAAVDTQGNFLMRGVIPGSYVLQSDFEDDGKRYSAWLPLEVSANIEGIDLKLQAPVEIHGRVIIEENRYLSGETLTINLVAKNPEVSISEDSTELKDDLSFKFSNAGLEQYDVSAYRLPEGFYLKSIRMGQQDVTETGLDLTQGAPAEELTLVLNPNGGVIDGSVKNAKDEAAVGATVTLIPDGGHRSQRRFQRVDTDQNGRFIFKGVVPGEYKLYAWEEREDAANEDPDFMKLHESAGEAVSVKEGGHVTKQLTVIPAENTAAEKPSTH